MIRVFFLVEGSVLSMVFCGLEFNYIKTPSIYHAAEIERGTEDFR